MLPDFFRGILRKLSPSKAPVDLDEQARQAFEAYNVVGHLLYDYGNSAVLARVVEAQAQPVCIRLAVVLDLDECLVHTQYSSVNYDYPDVMHVALSDEEILTVNKRPGVDAFLSTLAANFDVYLFTSADEGYANPIVDMLDPCAKIFKKRYYYDDCVHENGLNMKDLKCIEMTQSLAHVVLIDNNPLSFLPQPSNAVPIPSFFDNMNDHALAIVLDLLLTLRHVADVRPCLDQVFHIDQVLQDIQIPTFLTEP
ncbi:CTD small phosphatase [Thraustotheca clavata]|uniref:CTD small phosphatase n=1 Tax=Thraustotheca clavata TaxID=74557 RepID=A0A1V9Y669_9STRA|nr:CTD small phosphatase [Thraustotheca clavata]